MAIEMILWIHYTEMYADMLGFYARLACLGDGRLERNCIHECVEPYNLL